MTTTETQTETTTQPQPTRDHLGRLLPGHISIFHHHKPGTLVGRPKLVKAQVKDALAVAEQSMPAILAAMQRRALDDTHRDCQRAAEYLCDRIYGKAVQPASGDGAERLLTYRALIALAQRFAIGMPAALPGEVRVIEPTPSESSQDEPQGNISE